MSDTTDGKEWFIYTLSDPLTSEVRYVGFTSNLQKRMRDHISEARIGKIKTHKNHWISTLLKLGLEPAMSVIDRGYGEWQSVEQYWIMHHRMNGARLTNATNGGEGLTNPSPETREKISRAHRGHKWRLGYKHSPETIEKIRASNIESHKNDSHTEETKAKMSRTRAGKERSPEVVEKIRLANTGKKRTPEQIEAMRIRNMGRPASNRLQIMRVEDGVAFNSISDAAKAVGASRPNISHALQTGNKCGGYHWERIGATPPSPPRHVRCLNTMVEYDSIQCAGTSIGVHPRTIQKSIRTKTPILGYHWEYVDQD